eukprot:5794591-Prymnesium_polylepis.1
MAAPSIKSEHLSTKSRRAMLLAASRAPEPFTAFPQMLASLIGGALAEPTDAMLAGANDALRQHTRCVRDVASPARPPFPD